MSAYPPPTEDLPTFNPAVFFVDETGITLGEADARYVKLSGSIMTGNLAVPSITLNGSDVETDITALQTKTTDQSFSSSTTSFSGSVKSTGGDIFISGANKFIGVDNGVSSIKIKNSSNSGNIETVNPDNTLQFLIGGSNIFKMTNAQNLFYQPLKANTSIDIGDATTRFNTIYASTLNLPTISDVASSITTNTSNITTLTTKTTQLSYDSGTTTTIIGGSTLDVNATLALPNHSNVDTTLTNLNTKTSFLDIPGGNNIVIQTPTGANMEIFNDGSIFIDADTLNIRNKSASTTYAIFNSTTFDLDLTLALPNHSDVDTTLTTIESNITTNTSNISTNTSNIATNTTKLTGISFDSGTSKTTVSNFKTSDNLQIVESDIQFLRADGSSAGNIEYETEGIRITEARGGNATEVRIGGNDVDFKTGASGTDTKFTIKSDATPTLHLGTNTGNRGAIIKMEGVDGDVSLENCVLENRLFNGTDESELVIFKGNDQLGSNTDRIRLRAGQIAFDVYTGATTDRTAENIRATIDSNSVDTNVQMVITKAGNDNDSETNSNHCLRLTSGTNNRTMFMGVDDTDELGYINCAQSGATKPIAIQTRGSNLAVGGTTASFKLDITGAGRSTGDFTCNAVVETSSKKLKNVESSLNDVSTNQEALDLFNSMPLSKYTHIDKEMNKNFIHYGLVAEDMPNNIYRFDSDGYIPCIYQYGDIIKEDDKYKITFNEKLDLSKIQNEESNNIKCYSIKENKYDTDIAYILKDFEIIDENTIKGVFKEEFTENKIFVYGVEGLIPAINKNAYFELTSCVVKHLLKENNELKERLNKIEQILNIN